MVKKIATTLIEMVSRGVAGGQQLGVDIQRSTDRRISSNCWHAVLAVEEGLTHLGEKSTSLHRLASHYPLCLQS